MRNMLGRVRRARVEGFMAVIAVLAAPALLAPPVWAQDGQAESRLRRMESEIRALQRQVFPGGDGKYFGPQITPAPTSPTPAAPASTPVTDILVRMDAIEAQIARLTSQTELNTNKIAQIEARLASPPPAVDAGSAPDGAAAAPVAAATPASATPAPAPRPATSPVPSSQRVAAVAAIEKPSTGDVGDDEYSYGYRLWEAKFYPEAQQQLKLMIDKHPRHAKISYARNLLGRAYLDDGKPRDAATWFLQNYQADKAGARAPDSLLFLAESMRRLDDKKRACIALSEFAQTYAAEAAGRLKAQYDATRTPLKCA